MFAKLFSRITESSLMEEPLEVRYAFMMLLAMCDPTGHVIGTDVAIARRMNMPLEEFRRCITALSQPDPDSNSMEQDGRRITPSENERGYFVVNYLTYRDMKSEEHKRKYMREYMQNYREKKGLVKSVKTPVKRVNPKLAALNHAEEEGEVEGRKELRSCSEAEEPPTEPVLIFQCDGDKKEWNLTKERVIGWQTSFPALDVMQCCREARQWLLDNPTKRKTFAGMPAYLGRWMGRAQNNGMNQRAPLNGNGHIHGPAPAEKGEPARWRDFLKTLNSDFKDYGSCPSVHTEFRQWKEKNPE